MRCIQTGPAAVLTAEVAGESRRRLLLGRVSLTADDASVDMICNSRRDNSAPAYFFSGGGKFFKSFATAFVRFFCCFSGFALASIVLLATPRQTRSWFFES